MEIDIDLIQPSPYQPRLLFNIEDLKQEIQRDGLLSDLVVRKRGKIYELIDGERRWRALKELGWKTVPVRVIEIDNRKARRSVYKLNKIRENYTVEEEARYFKKLRDEGMTPWDISKELNVDFHWVLAHLNVFKFPEDIQKAVWTKQVSISHIAAIESVIGRSLKEALAVVKEILKRRLTLSETRKIISQQKEEVEKMRIEAAASVLPRVAPEAIKLETPEDFLRAAKALKKIAKKALTPEEKALREAEKKRRQEERRRRMEERRRRQQQRIEEEIRKTAWRIRAEERKRIQEEVKEKTGEESIDSLAKSLKNLREKIEKLESKKAILLEEKLSLTQALSFNCPHCNHPCVIYQEGDRYWIE